MGSELWSSLRPIGLDELNELASLETRLDRKYLVPPGLIEELLDELRPELRVLEIDGLRRFEYETVYFDTEDCDSYLAAAHSRPKRFKVRTRTYLDSQLCTLEVKTRNGRQRTVKHRLPYSFRDRARLTEVGTRFVLATIGAPDGRALLDPVLINHYARRTVLLPGADIRATIDSAYRCEEIGGGNRALLPATVIVETKSTGKPGPLDHLLWRAGHRPGKFSKYCTGLAVTRGGLPANKWHRTITRHMELGSASGPLPRRDSGASQAGHAHFE